MSYNEQLHCALIILIIKEDSNVKIKRYFSVEFSVYLPDLLDSGVGVDRDVETVVVEPSEPIDVRRNRQLTLDNMKLNRELVSGRLLTSFTVRTAIGT